MVIPTGGSSWQAYELCAHNAGAQKAGISTDAIRDLTAVDASTALTGEEGLAQRVVHQLTTERRIDDDLYRKTPKRRWT